VHSVLKSILVTQFVRSSDVLQQKLELLGSDPSCVIISRLSIVSKGLHLSGIYVTAYLSQSVFLSVSFEMLGNKCCLFHLLYLDFMKNLFLFSINNKLPAEDSP